MSSVDKTVTFNFTFPGQISTQRRKHKRTREAILEDGTWEDASSPPPIPPHTMEMYILPVGNSTSTTSTEGASVAVDSGTNDDGAIGEETVVSDNVFEDDSGSGPLAGTITCQNVITFKATVETGSCSSLDTPPRTYPRITLNHCSRDYVNVISNQDDLTRREFVVQQVAGKENTDGAMLIQNEELSEGYCGTVDDATSQSSIDIGFPPPIPPQMPDMFLVQTCEPTDHTTIHIPMSTNLSYTKLSIFTED